jgi:calcineurin-like phosphoesterase family protein
MKQKTFFTSDWHIGNSNVIRLSNRPFRDVEHMHQVLINNHNNTVPPDGIIYCLGDMLQSSIEVCTEVISQMNGTKILLMGNHDPSATRALRCGFDVVLNSAGIVIGKEHVTMSHCPLRGVFREDVTGMKGAVEGENWHGESRHWKFSIQDFGQFHLHGHIHCLSEDTEILTQAGFKKWQDISESDKALTRNPTTGKDSWEPITQLITSEFDGELIVGKSRHFHQEFTNNHRLLVKDRNSEGFDLKTHEQLTYKINKYPVTSNVNQHTEGLKIEDNILRLLVWIAADGSFDPNGSGVRFKFKKQRKILKLKELLTELNYEFTHCKRKCGVETLRFNYNKHPEILEFFDITNKTLPKALAGVNRRQAEIIFHTYAITDGCYMNGSRSIIQICTSKEREADLLQQLFIKNDIYCKIGDKVHPSGEWVAKILYVNLERSLTSLHSDINFSRKPYKGIVWCIQVNNQNFMIRHKGTVSFTGNSPNNGRSTKTLGRQYDVGVDANNYTPVSISTIERWIHATKKKESE